MASVVAGQATDSTDSYSGADGQEQASRQDQTHHANAAGAESARKAEGKSGSEGRIGCQRNAPTTRFSGTSTDGTRSFVQFDRRTAGGTTADTEGRQAES